MTTLDLSGPPLERTHVRKTAGRRWPKFWWLDSGFKFFAPSFRCITGRAATRKVASFEGTCFFSGFFVFEADKEQPPFPLLIDFTAKPQKSLSSLSLTLFPACSARIGIERIFPTRTPPETLSVLPWRSFPRLGALPNQPSSNVYGKQLPSPLLRNPSLTFGFYFRYFFFPFSLDW